MKFFARLFYLSSIIVAILLYFYPEYFNNIVTIGSDDMHIHIVERHENITSAQSENDTKKLQEATIIYLTVNNLPVEFSLESYHVDHIYDNARKYCETNAATFGVTEETLDTGCTQVVFNNLIYKINEKRFTKTNLKNNDIPESITSNKGTYPVQIKIPIADGNVFSISFDAARQSPQSVATYFCNQRAKELGLLNQQDIDSGCIPSIATYILEQLASIGYTSVGNEDATNENVRVDNLVSNAASAQEL